MTNPADPVIIAGFNPADPVPTPSASNSTNGLETLLHSVQPGETQIYTTDGVKTIEVFATDNAGSVGNIVTSSFKGTTSIRLRSWYLHQPTNRQRRRSAGQNFAAAPSPVDRRR